MKIRDELSAVELASRAVYNFASPSERLRFQVLCKKDVGFHKIVTRIIREKGEKERRSA